MTRVNPKEGGYYFFPTESSLQHIQTNVNTSSTNKKPESSDKPRTSEVQTSPKTSELSLKSDKKQYKKL